MTTELEAAVERVTALISDYACNDTFDAWSKVKAALAASEARRVELEGEAKYIREQVELSMTGETSRLNAILAAADRIIALSAKGEDQ